jgi:hypothetical protein
MLDQLGGVSHEQTLNVVQLVKKPNTLTIAYGGEKKLD